MAHVILPSALSSLAGGAGSLDVPAGTVLDAMRRVEAELPRLAGSVVDEQGQLRPHVALFVNGLRATLDQPLAAGDEVHIVPAISGGNPDEEIEVLAGTRKGLFTLRGRRGGQLEVAGRAFPGNVVEYAIRDPRTGRAVAAVTHGHFGPKVFIADDPTAPEEAWERSSGPAFPEDTGAALQRVWTVTPGEDGVLWAGVDPAALFKSEDGGSTWSLVRGLWDHPTRPRWEPGGGGLCLHSICPWPGEPDRLAVGTSAAGVWLTDDGGATWRQGVAGLVPRYIPEEARAEAFSWCIHNLHRAPLEPTTLYLQFHGGVYRSDDAGESWTEIGASLPADFGFPLAIDPRDPDRAFVVPLTADVDRVTPGGRVRVWETRDRGATWQERGDGLPDEAWLTILRQAFAQDGRDPLGLYFGATSGELFASADGGATWTSAAERLPPILSVRTS